MQTSGRGATERAAFCQLDEVPVLAYRRTGWAGEMARPPECSPGNESRVGTEVIGGHTAVYVRTGQEGRQRPWMVFNRGHQWLET